MYICILQLCVFVRFKYMFVWMYVCQLGLDRVGPRLDFL